MGDLVYVRRFDAFSVPDGATTIERTICQLRNAIMQGELRPGQKLIEAELCRSLDISRTTLREALRALEAEKLIELVPNYGPSVARLSGEDVESIHEVWALLTSETVARFAKSAKKADVARLEQDLRSLKRHIETNSPLGQLAATNSFFTLITQRCANRTLAELVVSLVSRINFLRAQALLHQGWGVVYAAEIEAILAAIKDGDPEQARRATRKHIASACEAAKQVTQSHGLNPHSTLGLAQRAKRGRSESAAAQQGRRRGRKPETPQRAKPAG